MAGVIMPDWYGQQFLQTLNAQESGNWRLQGLPAWKTGGRRVSTFGGNGVTITKQSKHQDLCGACCIMRI